MKRKLFLTKQKINITVKEKYQLILKKIRKRMLNLLL